MQQGAKPRSLARCALQCDAGSIKQAAIHGATVSRLRVIAGPALGFEHRRKTERECRARQGGQEKRKRTSRRRPRVRKKGIAGERRRRKRRRRVRGSCKACYPRARVCTSSTRLCSRRARLPLPFEIKPGLSRSSPTEPHEKISPEVLDTLSC